MAPLLYTRVARGFAAQTPDVHDATCVGNVARTRENFSVKYRGSSEGYGISGGGVGVVQSAIVRLSAYVGRVVGVNRDVGEVGVGLSRVARAGVGAVGCRILVVCGLNCPQDPVGCAVGRHRRRRTVEAVELRGANGT